MQKSLPRHEITIDTSTSDEGYSYSQSDIDLLKPQVHKSVGHLKKNSHNKLLKSKLHTENPDPDKLISSPSFSKKNPTKNENQVTFAEEKDLSKSGSGTGDGNGCKSTNPSSGNIIRRSEWKLGKEDKNGTPRILRVLRRHSSKSDSQDKFKARDKSPSACPGGDKSKSSVVVLYHEKEKERSNLSSKPAINFVRVSKSEQTTVAEPLPSQRPSTRPEIFRKKESTDPSPKLSLARRRRTHRRPAINYEPLNVNIIQEIPKCRLCKSDSNDLKQMAEHNHQINQKHNRELDESKRTFPFKSTPSGNFKVIPNQVVFETNKVSVLVADPKHTKVNVKADLNKSESALENYSSCHKDFQPIKQPPKDLPPGVTASTINHLQAQKKLPQISTEYIPRTQPYKPKHRYCEMEPAGTIQQSTINRQDLNQVPLASLGFTTDQPIDWDNITLPDKTELYNELYNRITNYKNADCIVTIGHDEFHCHLLVLQSYSSFFDEKNYKDIDLTESTVTSKAFSIIYDWMICESNQSCQLLRRDNILEIFMAAQFLGIKELEEQCWAFIDNNDLFSEDTAFLLYVEARKLGNTAVMELMVPRIMKFFLLLVSTKDFLELEVEELCLLLRSNYICVNSEMEVLMSAVRWLMHDWDTRRQYILDVLKCVRFGLIAPWQLVDVKRNPENPEFMELMSNPEVQKMVDDGLAFVIIKYWYGNQTEDYYRWIELLGLTEPTNRNWAGEDKNYVTYREFLLYLEDYQRNMILELKSRGSNTSSSTNQKIECSDARTWVNYNQNQGPVEITSSTGQVSCTANIGNRSWKFQKTPPPPPPTSGRINSRPPLGMPPEILSKYLSGLNGNYTKPDTQAKDNEEEEAEEGERKIYKTGNAAVNLDIWRNDEVKMSQVNHQEHHTIQQLQSNPCEPNMLSSKTFFCPKMCNRLETGDHNSDSSKSETEAAATVQSICRGYKTKRRFNNTNSKKTLSENERMKKIAQLLSADEKKLINKSSEFNVTKNFKACVDDKSNTCKKVNLSADDLQKNKVNASQQQQRLDTEDLDKIKLDMMDTPQSTSHVEKISKSYDVSITNNPINHIDACKTIEMIKPPNFLYNSDDKTGSISMSYSSTDIDDLFSPKSHKNLTIIKADIYSDHSLFFNDCEAVLVLGGIDPHEEYGAAGNTGKNIYRFKPLENAWEFVGEMPEPRHYHSVVYFKGRLYVAGGADPREHTLQRKNLAVRTVWSYDPASRKWFTEPAMLTPRKNFGLVVCGGKIFAIGGEDNSGVTLKSVEAFDPAKKIWRKMEAMHTARVGLATAVFKNLIWVAGGITKSHKDPLSKEVECYDPRKNSWSKIECLPTARCYAYLFVMSDNLWIIGGAEKPSAHGSMTESIETVDIWDHNSRSWRPLTKMATARHSHSVSSIDNQLLVIGGVTTVDMKTLKSVECFCCKRNKWIKGVASLPYPISGHSSVSLPPLHYFYNS
ncbi:uncharacterized protein LOC103571642 isoform X1 [Microplitis demolitor]|uniref:uncharacterized protein LOC103571642 isoform X1 n=1 Tax=Microplitis demolitor TaxID=69319 RepID=UPI0006D4D4FF|nr:uncharacterized protein LOC103571642 isoform X1 [Microplitis demolitor]XP_053592797.1 uncharacterized protein LOC103571642 isoform X1 [Microplitis demolitor]